MSAPETYTFLDPTRYCDMQGDGGPVVAREGDEGYGTVEYVRRDLAYTDADLERAVRAALEAAVKRIQDVEKSMRSVASMKPPIMSPGLALDRANTCKRLIAAIRAFDPAEIVQAAREGGE